MTTIASNLYQMAADSHLSTHTATLPTWKILRTPLGIAGAAGSAESCHRWFQWAMGKEKKPRLSKKQAFNALLLNDKGLFYIEQDLYLNQVHDGIYAIGTGAAFALGSMERDVQLGIEPDPVAAVKAAIQRDELSGGPVSYLTLHRGLAQKDKIQ